MKLLFSLSALIFVGIGVSGCSRYPSLAPYIPKESQGSIDKATKTGKACVYSVLLIPFGNSSTAKAVRDVGITKVAAVSREISLIFPPFLIRTCTVVEGE